MHRADLLVKFYEEHAAQARQHEDQRERMTAIVGAIAGALTGSWQLATSRSRRCLQQSS